MNLKIIISHQQGVNKKNEQSPNLEINCPNAVRTTGLIRVEGTAIKAAPPIKIDRRDCEYLNESLDHPRTVHWTERMCDLHAKKDQ